MKPKFTILMMLAIIGLSNSVNAQTTFTVNAGETLRVKCWSDGDGSQNLSLDTDCQVNLNGDSWGNNADTILARGEFHMEAGSASDDYMYYSWSDGADEYKHLIQDDGQALVEWITSKYNQSTAYEYVGKFWVRFIYTSTFTVTDLSTGNPISGAVVTVTGEGNANTNASGVSTIADLPNGNYSYSITASGYNTYNGNFTIDKDNVNVNVAMTASAAPTYDVSFNVSPTSKGISGATVSLTGYGDQVTDGSGNCTFTDVEDGTYSYTVVASGYQNAGGSVTVSGGNVSEVVYMDPLGVRDMQSIDVNVYPNPCVDFLRISETDCQWQLFDISGKLLTAGKGSYVNLSTCKVGYYVLKVTTSDRVKVQKIYKIQ